MFNLSSHTKEMITLTLLDTLSYAYCDNCSHMDDDDDCDGCYRKYQNWALSEATAQHLTDKIIHLIELENE